MTLRYIPDPIGLPQNVEELAAYAKRELERISIAFALSMPQELEELNAEPARKRELLMVVADGVNWDPGQGRGVYIWTGGIWNLVRSLPINPILPIPPVVPPGDVPPVEQEPLPPEQAIAIPTFHCAGLYWTPPSDPGVTGVFVQYKKASESLWRNGLNLWFDLKSGQAKGSVVYLSENTDYEFRLGMVFGTWIASATCRTLNSTPTEGTVVQVPNQNTTLNIATSGTANAWRVYEPAVGGGVVDVANGADNCITISASFVIIRGLTLKGARMHCVRFQQGVHDVIFDLCDVSGWGRLDGVMTAKLIPNNMVGGQVNAYAGQTVGFDVGADGDSAFHCFGISGFDRVCIQRCKIHDPRYGASPWDTGHPKGPSGVYMHVVSGQQLVVRYNEVYSAAALAGPPDINNPQTFAHYLMDFVLGEENFGTYPRGLPSDSDCYGNFVTGIMDDAFEMEGNGRNTRAWNNYIDNAYSGVASSQVTNGPCYIFRNVQNRNKHFFYVRTATVGSQTSDNDDRGYIGKAGSVTNASAGGGKRYAFHNTTLQAPPRGIPGETAQTLGVAIGWTGNSSTQPLQNTKIRNTILHGWKTTWTAINCQGGIDNDINYLLYQGSLSGAASNFGANNTAGVPVYVAGHGPESGAVGPDQTGLYQLASGPGLNDGEEINNFNKDFEGGTFFGTAPDRGAHEAGSRRMRFGIAAYADGNGAPVA